jgi:hypothetical protein
LSHAKFRMITQIGMAQPSPRFYAPNTRKPWGHPFATFHIHWLN